MKMTANTTENTMEKIPPFKLEPVFKEYIWGGSRLKTQFHKRTELPVVAESWELSVHPDGQSRIASGEYRGSLLGDMVARHPEIVSTDRKERRKIVSTAGENLRKFPVMIKLIDAKDTLSIQVHPNDEYACKVEGESGKTEIWIILDCEEDAYIYYGFKRPVTIEELRQCINQKTLTDILYKRPVKPGDVIFIPAGMLHAIGKGILLAEVQQNSNTTYRVCDFDRVGNDGKPRMLHIDKALDVTALTPADEKPPGSSCLSVTGEYTLEQLVACANFRVQRVRLEGRFLYPMDQTNFAILLCVDGAVIMESETETLFLHKGDCVFVPAAQRGFFLKGTGQILIVT